MISFIVMPVMLIEVASAAFILWRRGFEDWLAFGGFSLLLPIWAVTFFVMVPLHARLQADGFQPELHQTLLRWNWSRTLSWTVRGVIVGLYL
jgi:hypothetical protein